MFLAAQGFLVFSPQSSLLMMKPRKTKVTAHWILMLVAASAAVGGELHLLLVSFYTKDSFMFTCCLMSKTNSRYGCTY